ncbi:MAG: UDP-N-acetylmuramate--L-alanine ligase [Lachnospiraceae bacterium]|nr:UDP-N-acetylmuramate--L-alanine ligase [Lachnospiraceae bacterium]
MYEVNFNNPIRIHFIGIGGISMSGLAEILLKEGFQVSGSDAKRSDLTDHLEHLGAIIYTGQKPSNITDDIQLAVYTAAIHEDNPELQEIMKRKIPAISRAVLLGQLMKNYKTAVAVAGTHGKTTATSMLSQILLEANTDPTISVGGILKAIHGNIRVGSSETFVTEACEYTNSFLEFFPTVGIILNIEEDHLDFFKDIHDIRNSFHLFAKKLPKEGLLIINSSIEDYEELTQDLDCRVVTYGLDSSADYSAADITYDDSAKGSYTLMENGRASVPIQLGTTGEHNISNSLAVIAAAKELRIAVSDIQRGLLNFSGTDRRFEYKGKIGEVTIWDDYAHHPTEIAATLTTAKGCSHNQLWCIFQPHTYSRTKALLKDFAKALSLADQVILTDIFAARETDTLGISSLDLLEELKNLGVSCYYFSSFDEIENFVLQNCIHNDLLITMGAGDVVNIGNHLLGK